MLSMPPGARAHSHDLLPWYDYDEVAKVEIRQGGRKIERFNGYETEDEIKRSLRDLGHFGTFEVVGIDPDGQWMPNRGEMIVSPKRAPLDNFLRTKFYKSEGDARAASEAQSERDMLAYHASERRRLEEDVAEQRRRLEEKQEALFEEQQRHKEDLMLEQQRLAEERFKAQSDAQRKLVEAKEATLRESLAQITETMRERQAQSEQMSRNTLETMTRLFEDKSQTVQGMAESSQAVLTQMFHTQMDVLRREVDSWKSKTDDLQREMARREDLTKEREERLREQFEQRLENQQSKYENEIERYRDKAEMQTEALKSETRRELERYEDKYVAQIRALEEKLVRAEREKEEVKDRTRQLEIELIRSGFEFKVAETEMRAQTAGPSEHVRDTAELMKVAKEIGVDPSIVFKKEMGYDDDPIEPKEEKKTGLAESLFKEIGPALTEGLKSQLMGGTPQAKPASTNVENAAGGSSPLGLPSEEF
jgi:hypothetical protein